MNFTKEKKRNTKMEGGEMFLFLRNVNSYDDSDETESTYDDMDVVCY